MWNPTDEQHKKGPTGEMITSNSTVQSISDFRMRTGDFVFKADGTRWRISQVNTDTVISGFQAANDINAMVGYTYENTVREDENTISYLIPPDAMTLINLLDISVVPNYPVNFANWEVYNTTLPLIGDNYTPGLANQPM
jgi:hypothetical protein